MSKVTEKDGQLTVVETSMVDTAVDVVTAPLKVASKEKTYYSNSTLGWASIAFLAAGVFIGDRFGDKIPLLGQRRSVGI